MRVASRASALALAQAEQVTQALAQAGIDAHVVPMSTRGDRPDGKRAARTGAGASPPGVGEDKSRWVAELQDALLRGDVDLAVHSAKDVPGELPQDLALLGAPARAPAEDALCGAPSLEALRAGARVGTSSLRRAAQLRAARADLEVLPVRGNVDTRLRKLIDGDGDDGSRLDALVLARAGLSRLGRDSEIGAVLDPRRFVPAPGQGVLALEGRAGDERAQRAADAIGDGITFACLRAERALARELGASCNTPLGVHAAAADAQIVLRAWVGLPDGSEWALDELAGELARPEELAREVAARLRLAGALAILRRADDAAAASV
jgi:hydroxymethylbilane synthase